MSTPRLVSWMSADGPCIGLDDNATLIAEVFGEGNADRLRSSWNICAKYPQDFLDHMENREAALAPMPWLRKRNADRTRLVKALRDMVECFDVSDSPDHNDYDTWLEAKALYEELK